MPKCEVAMLYGLDPDSPYTISTPVIDGPVLELTEGIIYDFEDTLTTEFANTYQVASALAQVGKLDCWGVGVQVFGMRTRMWFTADPDVYTDYPQPFDDIVNPTVQAVGGGPRARVMGLKTKVLATNATSIMAYGLLRTGTADYQDGASLSGFTVFQKLRSFLNSADLYAITSALSVDRQFTALQAYPDRLYHGVRRAR